MRLLLSLVFAVTVLVAGPAAAQTAWANYKSAEHGFSVDMPGTPAINEQSDPELGTTTIFAAGGPEGAYVITSLKIPAGMENEPQALDKFLTGVLQGAEARETSRKSTTVSGVEARTATVVFNANLVGEVVAVIRGHRVYAFIAMRPTQGDAAGSDRFLKSVRLFD